MHRALYIIASAAAAALVGCGTGEKQSASSPTLTPAADPPSGALVFLSSGNYGSDLYTVNADGSNLTQLTDSPSSEFLPQWSPDGKHIAFSSSGRGNEPFTDVFVMDADGKNEHSVTNARGWALFRSWSPDGSRLLYSTDGLGPENNWVAGVDGANPVRIAEQNTCWSPPDWSPDGGRLVGCRCGPGERYDECSLFIVDADGTDMKTFPAVIGELHDPRWSPDGSRLLYVQGRNTIRGSVFVVDVAGGEPRKVYEGPIGYGVEGASPPVWSLDGSNIAVATGLRLVLVSPDRGEQEVAIDDRVQAFAFSPDGSRIAYSAVRDGSSHLFVADLNGGPAIELSQGPVGVSISWSPDSAKIVFSGNWERRNGIYWITPDGSEREMIATYQPGGGETPEPGLSLEGGCRMREEGSRWECLSPDGKFVASTDAVMKNGVGQAGLAVTELESGTDRCQPAGDRCLRGQARVVSRRSEDRLQGRRRRLLLALFHRP